MAQLMLPDIERLVHDRVKAALLHEDNVLGQALLLGSLALEGDAAWDYFLTRLLPAALPWYQPVRVNEPACGSGLLLLAAAAVAPEWAVKWMYKNKKVVN